MVFAQQSLLEEHRIHVDGHLAVRACMCPPPPPPPLGSTLQEIQLEGDTAPQGSPASPSPQASSGRMEQRHTLSGSPQEMLTSGDGVANALD